MYSKAASVDHSSNVTCTQYWRIVINGIPLIVSSRRRYNIVTLDIVAACNQTGTGVFVKDATILLLIVFPDVSIERAEV